MGGLGATDDTWWHHPANSSTFILNFLTTHDPVPHLPGEDLGWNGYATAVSFDGAHYADAGLALRRECAADVPQEQCTMQHGPSIGRWPANVSGIGSGSVMKRLKKRSDNTGEGEEEEEWVMNYSQQHPCLDNISAPFCQSIFFALSNDLINWRPVNDLDPSSRLIFRANTSYYHADGRTDTISALPRPGGGYVGYYTATPLTGCAPGTPSTVSCGAGMAVSDNGLNWEARPSPGPKISGEMGGVCQLGGKVWMTFDAGHLVSSPSLYGPFTQEKTNYNFLVYPSDRAAGYGAAEYPRLWGETNTGDSELCLITHGFGGYVGAVKRGILGADGALRAGWWGNNDNLRAAPLTVLPKLPANASVAGGGSTKCVGQCLTSGLWLEGTLPVASGSTAGLWLQTSAGGWASTVGPESVFRLGATDANGKPGHASTLDRGDFLKGKSTARWRALVRNSWEGMSIDKRGNTRLKASAMMVRPNALGFSSANSRLEVAQNKCLLLYPGGVVRRGYPGRHGAPHQRGCHGRLCGDRRRDGGGRAPPEPAGDHAVHQAIVGRAEDG